MLTLYANDPLELAEARAKLGWIINYIQLAKGRPHCRLSLLSLNNLHIWREHYDRPLHIIGDPPKHTVNIMTPVRYDGTGLLNGHPLTGHCIGLLDLHVEMDYATPSRLEHFGLSVDATRLMQQIRNLGLADDQVRFLQTGVYELPPAIHAKLVQQLLRTLNYLPHIEMPKAKAATAERQHVLESRIITMLCHALHTAGRQTREKALHRKAYQIVRLARDFLEDSLQEDIALADICNATGIGVRTLQRAFHATFNISPMAYLKARRLHQVHKQLKTAEPGSTTVIDTATQWGFWHMSHFSRDYKAFFGEPPSLTLLRY